MEKQVTYKEHIRSVSQELSRTIDKYTALVVSLVERDLGKTPRTISQDALQRRLTQLEIEIKRKLSVQLESGVVEGMILMLITTGTQNLLYTHSRLIEGEEQFIEYLKIQYHYLQELNLLLERNVLESSMFCGSVLEQMNKGIPVGGIFEVLVTCGKMSYKEGILDQE